MGQRHQQFIKTINPAKFGYFPEGFDMFNKRKKTVILPFHNQWLYGRSAPLSALRVLEHAQALPKASRTGNSDSFGGDSSPFGQGIGRYFRDFEKYISAVECILNYSPKGEYGVTNPGFGGSFFLDRKDKDEYKTMASDFTMGDNNDGITIIDVVNLKYCFMNICEYSIDDEEILQSASDLPYLEPVGAMEYMNAYYPVDVEKFSKYYQENHTADELRDKTLENAPLNNKIANRFKDFKVLSLDEVKKMFPKVFKNEVIK